MATKVTTSGGPKLSEVARHLVLPTGIVSTGWGPVARLIARMGVVLDTWQAGLGQSILAKRADGLYAASAGGIVISIARQVGKTLTIGSIIIALCVLNPGLTVLWTAHHGKTTNKTFQTLRNLAGRPLIRPHVAAVRTAHGEEAIVFTNGAIIHFGARGHGGGRGVDDVDVVVFDEAQILAAKTLDDMVPTANVAKNPLVLFMGTPPKPTDPSEVFRDLRRLALSGESEDLFFLEISADEGADVRDETQWRKANPTYPTRTPRTSMLRMLNLLGEASFRREALGIWDDVTGVSRLITASEWQATGVLAPPADGLRCFGVAFDRDGLKVSVSGAIKHELGVHGELIGSRAGPVGAGVTPLAEWLAARWQRTALIVMSGPAGTPVLHQALRGLGVPAKVLHTATTPEYTAACALLYASVLDLTFTHLDSPGQVALDDSVAVSTKQVRTRTGAWGWAATTSDGDETPLESMSLALWGVHTTKRRPGRKGVRV